MFAYLECALMFDGPDTDANGHDGDEDKWDEDEQPQDLRPAVLQLVTRQQLKHEQEHVHASTQHHALVVGVRLTLQPVGTGCTLSISILWGILVETWNVFIHLLFIIHGHTPVM